MTEEAPRANTSAQVVLDWGDGTYLFAIGGKQIEHIELATESFIGDVVMRLFSRQHVGGKDIYHVIYEGLLGGGMAPVTATQKMKAYVDGRAIDPPNDPSSPLKTAIAVAQALWFGVPELLKDEEPPKGEAQAGESPAPQSPSTEPSSSG